MSEVFILDPFSNPSTPPWRRRDDIVRKDCFHTCSGKEDPGPSAMKLDPAWLPGSLFDSVLWIRSSSAAPEEGRPALAEGIGCRQGCHAVGSCWAGVTLHHKADDGIPADVTTVGGRAIKA